MPLMVSNIGKKPVTLAAGLPAAVIPAGKHRNINGYVINNSSSDWDALENQRQIYSTTLLYTWVGPVDFSTGSLQISTFMQDAAIASVAIGLVKTATMDTLQSITVVLRGEPHTGQPIALPVFGLNNGVDVHTPYDIEIVDTKFRLDRGCQGAEVYLGLDDTDAILSDRYDASSGDVKTESATVHRRCVSMDSDLLVYCSNDYVKGLFQVFYRRQPI